jgi:hypothetical protein
MLLAYYLETNGIIDYTVFIIMVENISLACFDTYNSNFDMKKKKTETPKPGHQRKLERKN